MVPTGKVQGTNAPPQESLQRYNCNDATWENMKKKHQAQRCTLSLVIHSGEKERKKKKEIPKYRYPVVDLTRHIWDTPTPSRD